MQDQTIANKVVLVRFSLGTLGVTKKVRTNILNTDADKRLLKVHKVILDSPELTAITNRDAQVRNLIRDRCLPYSSNLLLLPYGMKEIVTNIIQSYELERMGPAGLVDQFVDSYKSNCEKAKNMLGSEYNSADYMSPEAVRGVFYFDYGFLSFAPPPEDTMEGLSELAKQKFQEKMVAVTDEITVLMRQTLLDLVDHLKTALEPNSEGKPKRLFASTIVNIKEFLDTFQARNITNDGELEGVVSQLKEMIHPGFSVETLRNDDSFKEIFHGQIEGISTKLIDLVEVIPGRKFKTQV